MGITFLRDSEGRITSATDHLDHSMSYVYDCYFNTVVGSIFAITGVIGGLRDLDNLLTITQQDTTAGPGCVGAGDDIEAPNVVGENRIWTRLDTIEDIADYGTNLGRDGQL